VAVASNSAGWFSLHRDGRHWPQQDPQGHGQDLTTHLGKILRIDVNHADAGLPYGLPADNPFRDRSDVRSEIWAYGFREPWRFSFDSLTGELWVGDVGQDRVEEVSIVRRGENHGWNVYEGFEPFSNRYRKEGRLRVTRFRLPAELREFNYGGYVYRGDKHSSFYASISAGLHVASHLGLTQEGRVMKTVKEIGKAPQGIASFSADERGEIYLVGYEGMIYHLDLSDAVLSDDREPGFGPTKSLSASSVLPRFSDILFQGLWLRGMVLRPL